MKSKIKKYLILVYTLVGVISTHIVNGEMRPVKSLRWTGGVEPVKVEVISSENCITLNYQVPNATLTVLDDEITCLDYNYTPIRITVGNAKMIETDGKPILPVITAIVIIPAGKEIDNINITRSGEIEHEGEYLLTFGLGENNTIDPSEEVRCNALIYGSDSPYPEVAYNLLVNEKHGVLIAYINIYPISYIPLFGEVKSYGNITLNINLKAASVPPCSEIVARPERMNSKKMGIENPDAISSYFDIECPLPPDRSNPPGFCDPADSYQYLVITNQHLNGASPLHPLQELIDWREVNCLLTVKVGIIEDIYSNYTGRDNAEKLRNYIIDAYNNWEIEYVLLLGDINILPIRSFYIERKKPYNTPSDLYFQCLNGDFNANSDKDKWGEIDDNPDLDPELFIGRASVEDEDEMSNFIFKTIKYETESQKMAFFPEALFAAEKMDANNFSYEEMNILRMGTNNKPPTLGYDAPPIQDTPIENTLYDYDGIWSKYDIIGKIESETYSIINHSGHSNIDMNMKMGISDANGLDNETLIFEYTQGCLPGDFEVDCIAEHFTCETERGMFAGIYNSRYGWYYHNNDGSSQRLQRHFWDAYFRKGIFRLGGLNVDSHEENKYLVLEGHLTMYMVYYETNLFGDPYTGIWIPLEYNMDEIYVCNVNNLGKDVYNAHNKLMSQSG